MVRGFEDEGGGLSGAGVEAAVMEVEESGAWTKN